MDWWWVFGTAMIVSALVGAFLALWASDKWWRD